jgi:hypothetical protein
MSSTPRNSTPPNRRRTADRTFVTQIDRTWQLADFLRLDGRLALAIAAENIAMALERIGAAR